MMARQDRKQRGIALVAVLVMLVLLTLLAVTMIRSGTVNLLITQNVQLQQEAESAARQGVEIFISDIDNFLNTGDTAITLAEPNDPTQFYSVTVAEPVCLGSEPREGDSMVDDGSMVEGDGAGGVGIESVYWELTATSEDDTSGSGAFVRMIQGVRAQMLAGSCN